MAKIIFCYQFCSPDTANEFIMRLYHQYIIAKRKLPKVDSSRLSYNEVMVESFKESKDSVRLLDIMNLLAVSCGYAYIKFAGPKA